MTEVMRKPSLVKKFIDTKVTEYLCKISYKTEILILTMFIEKYQTRIYNHGSKHLYFYVNNV